MYKLVFSNVLTINDSNDDIYSIEIVSKLDNSKLSFGTVSSVSLSLKLNNKDKRFSNYIFKNKSIECYINNVKKYKFYIDDVTMKNGFINITAYDKIAKLDQKFRGISYPCTLQDLIVSALGQAGLKLETTIFRNQGFIIHDADLSSLTCREVLRYCLEICGGIGILNTEEKFVIRWFSNNNVKEIDTNNFISYSSDEEDIEFNNVRFSRGNVTYDSNSDYSNIKGTIYITSDNPLLEHSTSTKIKSLIENLNVKHLSYFSCKVQISSIEKYSLGDCLSFSDENGNEKIMLVSNITIKNLSNVTVESLGIDTTVSESDESETDAGAGSQSYNFNIKGITDRVDVQFSECNKNTKIFVSCTMTFTKISGNITFSFDNKIIRTYTPILGTNTFSFIIDGVDQLENIMKFSTGSTYSYFEYNFIYCNCLIVDYSEEDDPDTSYEGIDEIEGYELYNVANFKFLKAMDKEASLNLSFKKNKKSTSNNDLIQEFELSRALGGSSPNVNKEDSQNYISYFVNSNLIYLNDDYMRIFTNWLKNSLELFITPKQEDYDYKVYIRKVLIDGTKTKFYDNADLYSLGISNEQIIEIYVYCPKTKTPSINLKTQNSSFLSCYFENSEDLTSLITKQPDGYYYNNSLVTGEASVYNANVSPSSTINGILWCTYIYFTKEFIKMIQTVNDADAADYVKLDYLFNMLPNLYTLTLGS